MLHHVDDHQAQKWFLTPQEKPSAKIRLFCFPYAGGGCSTYLPWGKELHNEVELVVVQPPGRGARIMDPLFDDMEKLVAELYLAIQSKLDIPYVFFGHSLGSRVAFELLTLIADNKQPLPLHFFASGSRAPHIPFTGEKSYSLPEESFKEKLKNLNGTPPEILENDELMALFIPILRADFRIAETYHHTQHKQFTIPLSILGGDKDSGVTEEHLNRWKNLFIEESKIYKIIGDHFFIDSNSKSVLPILNRVLAQLLAKHNAPEPIEMF